MGAAASLPCASGELSQLDTSRVLPRLVFSRIVLTPSRSGNVQECCSGKEQTAGRWQSCCRSYLAEDEVVGHQYTWAHGLVVTVFSLISPLGSVRLCIIVPASEIASVLVGPYKLLLVFS